MSVLSVRLETQSTCYSRHLVDESTNELVIRLKNELKMEEMYLYSRLHMLWIN